MALHPVLAETTDRIIARSQARRTRYLEHMRAAASDADT